MRIASRAAARRGADIVLVGDRNLLEARARRLGLDVDLSGGGPVTALHVALGRRSVPGRPDPVNARYVLDTLDAALSLCRRGEADAMVTAPVHKGVINDAGIAFTGHTEYLAQHTDTPRVVMLLAGGRPLLRVALATTHLPLSAVPAALDVAGLVDTLRILKRDLVGRFAITAPRILVAGLNPHAGEGGHLGTEDECVIAPAISQARRRGVNARGPYPADTLFTPRVLAGADAVLAMYHDQGLPVLKFASFGGGVNVTLGLPLIRTSVDHGTALDLARTAAGAGAAETGSLVAALRLAIDLAMKTRAPRRQGAPGR